MISAFERQEKRYPLGTFFTFVDADEKRQSYTYEEIRLRSIALVSLLEKKKVKRGSYVSVDMSNCPALVVTLMAAAYGGFTLVFLNHRLTEEEKNERLADLSVLGNVQIVTNLTEAKVDRMLDEVELFRPENESKKRRLFKRSKNKQDLNIPTESKGLAARELVHYAERNAALFDRETSALVMFTSGTTGRPKAVSLSWKNLCGAAEASNRILSVADEGLWQVALPLYHIGGFEVVVRSILNNIPFILYRHFDPQLILQDANSFGATHISVVDKMLQDLLSVSQETLACYSCVLLGGSAPNPITISQAVAQQASLFVSYGMTETSSLVALCKVEADFDGALDLLPEYEAQIITPNKQGFGQLAIKGPGVFQKYLNSPAPFTVDGFFLTGDNAMIEGRRIKIQERVEDMFVSGGENIYPSEIEEKIKRIPGVSDAYVFGAEDGRWGRRPVAFVERSGVVEEFSSLPTMDAIMAGCFEEEQGLRAARAQGSPQLFAYEVEESLRQRLSKMNQPQNVCVMNEFPRSGIGKIDKLRLQECYDERIEIEQVTLYHVRQKIQKPFVTAKTTMRTRESMIIEVKDAKGRIGLGECVAFSTDWYLPETLSDDFRILENYLIPLVLSQVYLHPSEVTTCFNECAEAEGFNLAKGALEPALWDLYGKTTERPFWKLLGSRPTDGHESSKVKVPAGLVLGIMPIAKTLEKIEEAVAQGYRRVKIKIKPGDDIERIKAVRAAFPGLTIMLDANQAYTEKNVDALLELDRLNIRCLEEPFDPHFTPKIGPGVFYDRLARLQKQLKTPICLDESITGPQDAFQALTASASACYALKIGKWGGVQNALDFYHAAQERGVEVWMGGMYETAISKRFHAAFETLEGISIPGDLSSSNLYFKHDISSPTFEVVEGSIELNGEGHESGIGCTLNEGALKKVVVGTRRYHRS